MSSPLEALAGAWAHAMWTACWQGGLAILAVWLACRVFPRMSPSIRQALWWLVCLKLVVGVVWIAPVPVSLLPPPASPLHSTLSKLAPPPVQVASPSASGPAGPFPWNEVLLAIWFAGLLATSGVALRSGLRMRRIVRAATAIDRSDSGEELRRLAVQMGIAAPPRLLESAEVSAPLVVGHWRPTILLPVDFERRLDSDERRMALAHELAHVRRRDLWLALVPSVAYALFFFFPPVWIACREWAADREATCDTEAILTTGAVPKAYGQLLMKIVSGDHRRAIAGLGATANFNTLKRRIALMKEARRPARGRWTARGVALAGSLLVIPWSLTSQTHGGVLVNAGMESGKYQPSGWLRSGQVESVRQIWDRTVSRSGSSSLCISRSDDRYWPITQWVQTVKYDGHSRYIEFGAWIKADAAHKAVLDVQFVDSEQKWTHAWAAYIGAKKETDGPATHGWTWYSGTVEIPKGTAQIRVALQDYGGGTVWMDDASAKFVDRPGRGWRD